MPMPIKPPEWIADAPIQVEESVEVDAPPSAVWAFVADHERWPEWFGPLTRIEITAGAEGVGGGRKVWGGNAWFDEEFTAWDVDEHFAFAVIRCRVPIIKAMAESVRIEALDDSARCRVTYRQGLQARFGFGRVLASAWRPVGAQLREALNTLKRLAEAS